MWAKVKDVVKRYWKWLLTGLGALLALLFLGKRKSQTVYRQIEERQLDRNKAAEEINNTVHDAVEQYYKDKRERHNAR